MKLPGETYRYADPKNKCWVRKRKGQKSGSDANLMQGIGRGGMGGDYGLTGQPPPAPPRTHMRPEMPRSLMPGFSGDPFGDPRQPSAGGPGPSMAPPAGMASQGMSSRRAPPMTSMPPPPPGMASHGMASQRGPPMASARPSIGGMPPGASAIAGGHGPSGGSGRGMQHPSMPAYNGEFFGDPRPPSAASPGAAMAPPDRASKGMGSKRDPPSAVRGGMSKSMSSQRDPPSAMAGGGGMSRGPPDGPSMSQGSKKSRMPSAAGMSPGVAFAPSAVAGSRNGSMLGSAKPGSRRPSNAGHGSQSQHRSGGSARGPPPNLAMGGYGPGGLRPRVETYHSR
ncbi:hypothetical protein ACLMJK_002445 [Lecanora helva]